jgi:hypothetical protein
MSQLTESINLLEARREAFRDLKTLLGAQGGKVLRYGPFGVRVANRAWDGVKRSIEQAGGRFSLKKRGKTTYGQVEFNGHKFNVAHEPDAYPGEGDLISFADGSL